MFLQVKYILRFYRLNILCFYTERVLFFSFTPKLLKNFLGLRPHTFFSFSFTRKIAKNFRGLLPRTPVFSVYPQIAKTFPVAPPPDTRFSVLPQIALKKKSGGTAPGPHMMIKKSNNCFLGYIPS